MRRLLLVGLLAFGATPLLHAQQVGNCATGAAVPSAADGARPTVISPVSSELFARTSQLGTPSGVLAQAFDEAQSVDRVLYRLRLEGCEKLAMATPASAAVGAAAGYQPKTQYDNTPWRFDMSQNGKRMTAEEFDAWMKARGVRVAKGAPAATPVAETAPAESAKKD